MPYRSTKTYGHNIGLSCCFRQWRAHDSHCRFMHGYALEIRLVFEADVLDERNWVVDFGGLKSFKGWLENTFDHKTLVAEDDPALDVFEQMKARGLIDMMVVPATGCEKFAEYVYGAAQVWLLDNGFAPRCRVVEAEVREHGANSAIYRG